MRRARLAVLSIAGALACGSSVPVRGDDAPKAPAAAAAAPLELRVYPVRALLRGHLDRRMDRGPFPASPDAVNDETRPLFGRESDEPLYALGEAAAALEGLKAEVGGPGAWEREGVSLAFQGASLLAVRAPHDLQARVAAWLAEASRSVLRTVVLDVVAFRGDAADGRGEGGVAGAVARGAWTPLGAVRVPMLATGAAVGRAGAVRAFLQDFDVEVAEDSNTVDPIVGVAPEGLAVEAHSVPAAGGRVLVRLRGWWASPAAWEAGATKEGDRFEKPAVEGTSFETTLEMGDGAWALLPGSGHLTFAARARIVGLPAAGEAVEGVLLSPSASPAPEGPLVLSTYDVRDLGLPIAPGRGVTSLVPAPSNFTPPEPPTLPDAAPPISVEALLEVVKAAAATGTWEREGASLEAAQGFLRARTDAARQKDLAGLLDRLRATLLRTTRLRATVVALPWASLPEWWAGLPDDFAEDGGAALLARPGARVVESSGLRLREGERRASVGGTHRSYVADYDVEIAKASAIGNPIVRSLFEGVSLDVENDRSLAAPAARLALRLDAGRLVEMRQVPTRHGDVECPVVDLSRAHGEVTVPLGATRVVAAWASGGEVRLVLLTVNGE